MFGQRDSNNADAGQNQAGAPALPSMPTDSPQPGMVTPTQPVPSFSGSSFEPTPPAAPANPTPMTPPPAPAPAAPTPTFASSTSSDDTVASPEELARMKADALQHLQPLVDSLQQSPEEEFRTLMMMIQATDDKTLLKKALDAAKKIQDDKIRAQAMLDVINEINYFAQTTQE